MNYKRSSIIIFSIIVVLILSVLIVVYQFLGGGVKEVRAAKKFIGLLYSKNIVDKTEEYDSMIFSSTQKASPSSDKYTYSVATRDFGVDLDSDYKVVGFINKASEVGEEIISEEDAIKKAEMYLDIICKNDFKFKEVMKNEGESPLPYHKIIFTRYEDDYPFYSDTLGVYIDKTTGKLDGYTNVMTQAKPKHSEVLIKVNEAEDIAIAEFEKLNINAKVEETTYLAYCDKKDVKETELAYVVTILGEDVNNKEVKYKYFVSSESGNVINFQKDTVTTTTISS